ncbi:MAG: murein biosynthesis integral membrane protein MurJ [Caldilineaceae bacterium]
MNEPLDASQPAVAAPEPTRTGEKAARQPKLRSFFASFSWRALLLREFTVPEASLLLMISFFTSAVLGALRQVLFNAQFGVGVEANAYYAAFRLPDTLFNLIAGGALSSAIIPVLVGTVQREGEKAGQRLIALVLTAMMATLALIVLGLEIFTPAFVHHLLAPGFDEPTAQLTITLTRIKLLQPLILAIGSVATAILNSRNQFLLPSLSIITYNFTLIGGILLARVYSPLGVFGPTLGTVVGAFLQVIILWPGLSILRGQRYILWDPKDRHLREVVYLLVPNGLSAVVNYAGTIADTAFASLTAQLATLPVVYNAVLLANLPVTLLGYAVGLAAFPRLAARAEAGAWFALRRLLLLVLGITCALTLVAIATIYTIGRPVIRLLFEHGRFDAAAGDLTYAVLLVYAVGLPVHVATEIITRGLIALRDTRTPLFTNIGQLIGRATIMALFIEQIGIFAIPTAMVVSSALETLVLGIILTYKIQRRIARLASP